MIHIEGNQFEPGSKVPKRYEESVPPVDNAATVILDEYLESKGWETGQGLTIFGSPGSGKTTIGMAALYGIFKATKSQGRYLTEADYLADLRRLWRMEEMATKSRDDATWMEYMEWERLHLDIKEDKVLFLDDVGIGYTPMHRYEIEILVRGRNSAGLTTIVALDESLYENFSESLQNTLTKINMITGC